MSTTWYSQKSGDKITNWELPYADKIWQKVSEFCLSNSACQVHTFVKIA